MTGRPTTPGAAMASSSERATIEGGTDRPTSTMAALKRSRSSAQAMASAEAPIISVPLASSTPDSVSCMARLRAVCPPNVGNRASGRSRSMMRASTSTDSGST